LTELLNTAIEIATAHHENWDGTGYPKGLSGNAIPLGGRLMCIADVYDALISKRSYKESWTHEEACAEVISLSGTKFDPYLIEAFKREMDNFKLIAEIAKD
jgi:response regulator RpfG family c-di-GMP phosphodiesterase